VHLGVWFCHRGFLNFGFRTSLIPKLSVAPRSHLVACFPLFERVFARGRRLAKLF
jgi:hypothetical protein